MLIKEEEDEILDEELTRSYIIPYKSWVNIVKINEDLQGQVLQLSQDKGALEKELATLKEEILKKIMAQSELNHHRKMGRMMNSGTASLDHILCMGTTSKTRDDIGYKRGSPYSKSTT